MAQARLHAHTPHHLKWKRLAVLLTMLSLLLCLFYANPTPGKNRIKVPSDMCWPVLSIYQLEKLAGLNKAIFFLETNVHLQSFSMQSECAFESAAANNPTRPVVVLADSKSELAECSEHLSQLPNLHLVKIDFGEMTKGTVLQGISSLPLLTNESQYYLNQISDVFRVAVLNRFGGAYLDTDIISRTEMPTLQPGSHHGLAFVQMDRVTNAALIFHRDNPILKKIMEKQMARASNISMVETWGILGTQVIHEVADAACFPTGKRPLVYKNIKPGSHLDCGQHLRVLPSHLVHPFNGGQWMSYFDPKAASWAKDAWKHSFAAHIFNNMRTRREKGVSLHKDSPIAELMRMNCPRTAGAKLDRAIGNIYGTI